MNNTINIFFVILMTVMLTVIMFLFLFEGVAYGNTRVTASVEENPCNKCLKYCK